MMIRCTDCLFKFEPNMKGRQAKVCPFCRKGRKDKWRRDQAKLDPKLRAEARAKLEYKTDAAIKPPRSNVESRSEQNEKLKNKFVTPKVVKP